MKGKGQWVKVKGQRPTGEGQQVKVMVKEITSRFSSKSNFKNAVITEAAR